MAGQASIPVVQIRSSAINFCGAEAVSLTPHALRSPKVIYVGVRGITRLTESRGGRYTIHLPTTMNDLWELLWERKARVRVYLEIVDEGQGNQ
ncbi:MAG: hypothetical protein ABWK01_06840 [Infirmifilum sp.]